MLTRTLNHWFRPNRNQPVRQTQSSWMAVVYFNKLHVGTLTRINQQWRFKYSDAFKAQSDVAPITDFPDKNQEYHSSQLWPFFALRIPSPNQPSVREFIERESSSPSEEALLSRFGHRSASNPFTLALV
jgi:HipA-like protein